MISYKDFQEYYMFLDDYLFNAFEEIKSCKCFNVGCNTQYEGIIDISKDLITIAYAYLDEYGQYTEYTGSLQIPSNIVFNDDAFHEWIQVNKVHGSFNT